MFRYFPLAAGIALILAGTVVHGMMTLRWTEGSSAQLAAVSERYQQIPKQIGDWVGEDTQSNPEQMVAAGATASISRRYRNTKTHQVVQVFMICGLARNTAVHTPDVCYLAAGFKMNPTPYTTSLLTGATKSKAYVSTFSKQTQQGQLFQRILWTWNGGDGWEAPDSPRMSFRGWSPLNKVYLIASATTAEKAAAAEKEELAQFANIFLPAVNRILYPPGPSGTIEGQKVSEPISSGSAKSNSKS